MKLKIYKYDIELSKETTYFYNENISKILIGGIINNKILIDYRLNNKTYKSFLDYETTSAPINATIEIID